MRCLIIDDIPLGADCGRFQLLLFGSGFAQILRRGESRKSISMRRRWVGSFAMALGGCVEVAARVVWELLFPASAGVLLQPTLRMRCGWCLV